MHKIFSDICDEKNLKVSDKAQVLYLVGKLSNIAVGLGFCLSEHSDMLSQWRGYAQNGEGFSIGFSRDGLEKLSKATQEEQPHGFQLQKVNYDIESQRQTIEPIFKDIQLEIEKGAYIIPTFLGDAGKSKEELKRENQKRIEAHTNIAIHVLGLFPVLFKHKNPAFNEESEWRIVSIIQKSANQLVEYRTSGSRLIPYIRHEIPKGSKIIKEVVLGPKNETPNDVVELALKRYGYDDVEVRRSSASYR